jgi:hypothetical protein
MFFFSKQKIKGNYFFSFERWALKYYFPNFFLLQIQSLLLLALFLLHYFKKQIHKIQFFKCKKYIQSNVDLAILPTVLQKKIKLNFEESY